MRTIFIVGAGKGLGNSAGRKFGANGFRVVLMSRNEASLKEYERAFRAEGIDAHTKRIDVTDNAGTSRAISEAVDEFGTPDVLLYNVGITRPDSDEAAGISAEVLKSRYQSDVIGAYHCLSLIATDEFARKNGAVLITGGGLAMYPSAEYLPLSMDKAALELSELNYLDYIEVVHAIEALGGEVEKQREFSGDEYYESLKHMQ